MHEFWRYVLLCIAALPTTWTQSNELASLPALLEFTLESGSSASFHAIPVGNRTFITLNVCSFPADGFPLLQDATLLYLFNSSDQSSPLTTATANQGFANLTLDKDQEHWITVNTPGGSPASEWIFQLGASTTEPMHLIEPVPLFEYADSGNDSALFAGPTYFPSLQAHQRPAFLAMPTNQPVLALSSCFLTGSNALVPQSAIQVSNTTRGVVTLSAKEGATGDTLARHLAGGVRDQFFATGLDPAVNYTVWGLVTTDQQANSEAVVSTGSARGLRLYQPQSFTTKSTPNCRLLFEFPTCPTLAYAAPSPPEVPTQDLYNLYDSLLLPHIQSFNTTLYQFPCNVPSQNKYSSVRTCTDCLAAYTSWLCSVVLPRCTDIPADQLPAAQANYSIRQDSQIVLSQEPIPSSLQTLLIRTDPALSRTPQFSNSALANSTALAPFDPTSPFPYAEVPPCSSVCNLVAASCPCLIGWNCPLQSQTMAAAYGRLQSLPFEALQGGDQASMSRWGRPADRFGNVFCNAMGTDVLLAVRTSGGQQLRMWTFGLVLSSLTAGWLLAIR